jgi:alkylation response protein AidB-like acyl-CoA dehydrogenase
VSNDASDDLRQLHDELRKVARDLLGAPVAGEPVDLDWPLAASLGWLGLEVPEALGGSGASFAEVAVVGEELGRAAAASPFLGTAVLGVGALAALEPGDDRDGLLAGIAAGDEVVAVAVPTGEAAAGAVVRPEFRLARTAAGLVLDGGAAFVPDAPAAGRLLVIAADPDGVPVVVVADLGQTGLAVDAQPVLDASRDLGAVVAASVPVADDSVLRFAGDPQAALARLVQRGALAVAVDCLGVAGAMLDATVAYARVRHQFGRPIGSFQAVKHACADMLVQLSLSRELVAAAVDDVVGEAPGAATSVAMAKAHAGEMAVGVAGSAMQLHGGIGYTWESGVPLHLKRAALDRSLFGSPRAHRAAVSSRFRASGAGPRTITT